MSRDVAYLNGTVVRWARERAGLELNEMAAKLGKGLTVEHVRAWEIGKSFPTFTQAELIAEKLRVPLAVLFMNDPPEEKIPIPDLQTVFGQIQRKPSLEFLELLNDCIVRQQWYQEDRMAEGAEPLPFVGRNQIGDDPKLVASDIAKTLGLTHKFRQQSDTWETFLSRFIQQTENVGVLVMRSSVLRHASIRGLKVDEFRGFAISDPVAPLIFINSRDARAAQIFTLAHELAHIWIEQSGISNPNPTTRLKDLRNPTERFCNEVAAELLIPETSLLGLWNSSETEEMNLKRISTFHRVSKMVAIIRARDLEKLSYDKASALIESEYERYKKESDKQQGQTGGPSFWLSFSPRNSHRFTEAVISALKQHRVLHLEAANLLGVKLGTLSKYIAYVTPE
jgi:Zn-dependent peptidase ImmA (M78 family)/transcriptional regulator with XRE-family HTH domain